jgi:hypothetical protein
MSARMHRRRPLTDEEKRVMLAALRRQIRQSPATQRWLCDVGARPSRKAREYLRSAGYVKLEIRDDGLFLAPTELGLTALRDAGGHRVQASS